MSKYGFIAFKISDDCTMRLFKPVANPDGTSGYAQYYLDERARALTFTLFDGEPPKHESPKILGNTLLIPCETEIIDTILDFSDMQRLDGSGDFSSSTHAYYFNADMTRHGAFQLQDTPGMYVGGSDTAYAAFLDARDRRDNGMEMLRDGQEGVSAARINCWTGAQGVAQYIGGLDLGEIDPHIPYFYRAFQISGWIREQREIPENKAQKMMRKLSCIFDETKMPVAENTSAVLAGQYDENSPPYFITSRLARFETIEDLLSTNVKIEGSGKITINDYLSQAHQNGLIAKSKPIDDHIHMREGQETVAESAYNSYREFI